jgi:hypothetical protein
MTSPSLTALLGIAAAPVEPISPGVGARESSEPRSLSSEP